MKYVIKQYDKNGRLVERYNNFPSYKKALEAVEWFKEVDKREGEDGKYTYEIVEEE